MRSPGFSVETTDVWIPGLMEAVGGGRLGSPTPVSAAGGPASK